MNSSLSCVACGRRSRTEFHFGACICSACRSFFRRTVRSNLKLKCIQETTNCIVDYTQRAPCRSCRYRRCIDCGMKPETVQKPRDPIKVAEQPRYSSDALINNDLIVNDSKAKHNVCAQTSATNCSSSSSGLQSDNSNCFVATGLCMKRSVVFGCAEPNMTFENSSELLKAAWMFDITQRQLMEAGLKRLRERMGSYAPLRELTAEEAGNLPDISECSLPEWFAYLQIYADAMIDTARGTTEIDSLPVCDQMALLRSFSWLGLILIDAWKSRNFTDLIFTSDEAHVYRNSKNRSDRASVLFSEVLPCLRSLEIDTVEFALLKSIAFWNGDVVGKQSKAFVREKRNKYLVALEVYVSQKRSLSNGLGNMGRMLMLLVLAEKFANYTRQAYQKLFCFDHISEEANLMMHRFPVTREVYLIEPEQ